MVLDYHYNYAQLARESGFKLRQYCDGPMDWRLIGSIEIERLLRDQSLEQIDGVLEHLSETPLGTVLDTHILDSGISKYFILSQFSIQYLLFCRHFLDETVKELREALAESQQEVASLRIGLNAANNEVLQSHKKINEIEALHEVIYPCHVCPKSFITNDALNIHIRRRHSERSVTTGDRRHLDSPKHPSKDKEQDMQLINTIKLELEIKQLKERLNVAEKEIRERRSWQSSPREKATLTELKSIGIQNNLIEQKEKDDEGHDIDDHNERKEQLLRLQEKIQEFENWRVVQKERNEESITEINKKLSDIAAALESVMAQRADPAAHEVPLQKTFSPSVDDLEHLLTRKVVEISKANADKLQEVIHHMDVNYKEKLEDLEREIKRKRERSHVKSVREGDSSAREESLAVSTNDTETSDAEEWNRLTRNIPKLTDDKAILESLGIKEKRSNDTFIIEAARALEPEETNKKPRTGAKHSRKSNHEECSQDSPVEDSDIKSIKAKQQDTISTESELDEKDRTDASESLTESSKSERDRTPRKTKPAIEKANKPSSKKDKAKSIEDIKKTLPRPKMYTRKDAKKMSNTRLAALGIDLKAASVSTTSMRKVTEQLLQKREDMKQTYPNFNNTRNRIKQFVDKLCSMKMPKNAEEILKSTQPYQPIEAPTKRQKKPSTSSTIASNTDVLEPMASTFFDTAPVENDDFQERLQDILLSPVRRPEGFDATPPEAHSTPPDTPSLKKPQPVPRKHVMFISGSKQSLENLRTEDEHELSHESDEKDFSFTPREMAKSMAGSTAALNAN